MSDVEAYYRDLKTCRWLGSIITAKLDDPCVSISDDDIVNKLNECINKMKSIYYRLKNYNSVNNHRELSSLKANISLINAKFLALTINLSDPIADLAIANNFYTIVKINYRRIFNMTQKKYINPNGLIDAENNLQLCKEIVNVCSLCVEKLKQVSDKGLGYKDRANRSQIYLEKIKKIYRSLRFELDFPSLTPAGDSTASVALQENEPSTLKFRNGKKKIKFTSYTRSPSTHINRLPSYRL